LHNKNIYYSILVFFTISFSLIFNPNIYSQEKSGKYIIVIHGGAGTFPKDAPDSLKQAYLKSLAEALTIGKDIIQNGGSGLDAVERVINYFENNILFNAGKGAVFTSEGKHELDASIMCGKDLSCGAVAGVTIIKHPISLARLVMEKTPHVLFAGNGADQLGLLLGVEVVPNSYFHDEDGYNNWLKSKIKEQKGETVGCVVLDLYGNMYAGTSTGGMQNKMPGRVGDSPLVNAGTYANNKTCGVSATGKGELFIRNTVAYNISALMEYKGYSLNQACEEMIYKRLPAESGGIIALDKDGNYEMIFNTTSMFRGVANSEGVFNTEIWK
jgi:beta-aspartyl-peptidase (threonine type)